MLIVCPSCTTSYQVEPSSLGAAGRSMRCVRCRAVWFASNTGAMAAIARAHREDMAAFRDGNLVEAPEAPAPDPATTEAPTIEAAPPLASQQDPVAAELPAAPTPEAPIRDDRGPAPLLEARDYQVPEPIPTPVEDAATSAATSQDEAPLKASDAVDIETLAARRMRRSSPRRARTAPAVLSTAILLLIAINAGLIAWRAEVVRFLPQTASYYAAIGLPVNLRELAFADIATHRETHDGVPVLVVEGTIKSQSHRVSEVPRLQFAVRNGDGREIYAWTALPEHNAIAPGGSIPFRSQLASPPHETHAVLVRFFNRRDLGAAGIQ